MCKMINYLNDFNQHSTIEQDEGSKEEALTKDVFTEKGEDLYEEMLFFFTGRIKSERSRKERSISFPLRVSAVIAFFVINVRPGVRIENRFPILCPFMNVCTNIFYFFLLYIVNVCS